MPKNCFVPGCTTTFKSRRNREPGEKMLTFFTAPKDPILRKQWHIASRRADREMNAKDVVCELHFSEDCLLRYFTTELYDGSTFKLKRDRPALKKGSIPTVFSFSKSNSDSVKRGRKKKLCTIQDKQGGNGSKDFDFRRNLSLSKLSANGRTNSSDKKIPELSFRRNEHFSTGISDYTDEDELPMSETDSFVQEDDDEIPEKMSSSDEDMPSTSKNFIVEGHEEIFGKFVASELKILSCDPPLYLRTKEKIWRVLEDASQTYAT